MNGQSTILTPNKLLEIPICPEFSSVPQGHIRSGWSSISDCLKKQKAGHQVRYDLQVAPLHYGRRLPNVGKQALLVADDLIFSACA